VSRPKKIEDGIEISQGTGYCVRSFERDVTRMSLEVVYICGSNSRGQDFDNRQRHCSGKPKPKTSTKYHTRNNCLARIQEKRYADSTSGEQDEERIKQGLVPEEY